jgi:hypothetical protein
MKTAFYVLAALAVISSSALAIAVVDDATVPAGLASTASLKGDRLDAPVAPKADLLLIAGGYEALQISGLATVAFPVAPGESFAVRIPLMVVSAD